MHVRVIFRPGFGYCSVLMAIKIGGLFSFSTVAIEIINALYKGVGQHAVSRLTNTDRKTVARLALRVGRGSAEQFRVIEGAKN